MDQDGGDSAGHFGELPGDGESDDHAEDDFATMQVRQAATMFGLNPDGGFNEQNLNQRYRRMALLLHPDAAVRNGISSQEATAMFQQLGNARDLL